jgi:hypothetical protein
MDPINFKERDATFQRAMQSLIAEARETGMPQEEYDRRRKELFDQCYSDVEKMYWPTQFD